MSFTSVPDALAWVVKAERDLLNIANNVAADETPWDTVCFHAQQAAGRLLKALLTDRGSVPPYTHDLVALLALCTEHEPGLADLETDCRSLTVFAVSSRYPDDVFDPDEADGRAMEPAALRVQSRVLPCLTEFGRG